MVLRIAFVFMVSAAIVVMAVAARDADSWIVYGLVHSFGGAFVSSAYFRSSQNGHRAD